MKDKINMILSKTSIRTRGVRLWYSFNRKKIVHTAQIDDNTFLVYWDRSFFPRAIANKICTISAKNENEARTKFFEDYLHAAMATIIGE